MAMHMMWPRDKDAYKDAKIEKEAAARVWRFAKPYRGMVVGFLVTVVIEALLGLVPPLLFGRIIDDVIPNQDKGLLAVFAANRCNLDILAADCLAP